MATNNENGITNCRGTDFEGHAARGAPLETAGAKLWMHAVGADDGMEVTWQSTADAVHGNDTTWPWRAWRV